MTALSIDRLELRRPGGFHLGPISLAIEDGSRTALVGRSGAGKSTLLRCVAGLETPSAGKIVIDDRVAFDGHDRLAPHQRKIGFVFQGGGLWPHLDALSHLRFAAPRLGDDRARALLSKVGLARKEGRRPSELSGGEAQRLALARALAGEPSMLLLDEPLRSLDVHLRVELCLLIRNTVAETGITLLAVTHDRDEAMMLADHAVVLDDGKMVESGAIAHIASAPQSAHGAALLAQATCFQAIGNGSLATVFGSFERPSGLEGEVALAVLPGDVTICDSHEGITGIVLYNEPMARGALVHVELRGSGNDKIGARLVVPHDRPLTPGAPVSLRLESQPRFLPFAPRLEP